MAGKVALRVLAMLVCVVSANLIVAAYVASEVELRMPWTDEQAAPLFGIVFRTGMLASVFLAGALWRSWLSPPEYRPSPRIERTDERPTHSVAR